jgi:myo-inositol-1(or 4)-monophosphatase
VNLTKFQNAAEKAARAAGALMRANLRSTKKVNAATSHDIKLELDVRCQRTIERILRRAFPESAILGEEGVAGNAGSKYRWVIDPIDGTVNFAYGIPHACVSIALQTRSDECRVTGDKKAALSRGQSHVTRHPSHATLLGVVYDPFQDEMWTATRGGPAQLNGKTIHVSRRRKLGEAIVSIGFTKSRESLQAMLPHFCNLVHRVRKVRMMGAAALGLTYVASGRFDAYLECEISLWDIAAGGLIIEAAGGEFSPQPIPGEHKYSVIATNGLITQQLPKLA